MRNHGVQVRVARFHNIFGPDGTWDGGREKAPAALCRKIAQAPEGGEIEIWGDGMQTRSFLYVDECVEAVRRLVESDFIGPVNIGSEEMVTINQLAECVMEVAGKHCTSAISMARLVCVGATQTTASSLKSWAGSPHDLCARA